MMWFDLQHSPAHSTSSFFPGTSSINFSDIQFCSARCFRKRHCILFVVGIFELIKEMSQNCFITYIGKKVCTLFQRFISFRFSPSFFLFVFLN